MPMVCRAEGGLIAVRSAIVCLTLLARTLLGTEIRIGVLATWKGDVRLTTMEPCYKPRGLVFHHRKMQIAENRGRNTGINRQYMHYRLVILICYRIVSHAICHDKTQE